MPIYTSLSFPGHPPLSLKLRDDERPLADFLASLGSARVRNALNLETFEELERAAAARGMTPRAFLRAELMKLAAASSSGARRYDGWPAKSSLADEAALEVIRESSATCVLDPFGGRANYAALAAQEGLRAWYCESSPLFRFLAEARLTALASGEREALAEALREFGKSLARPVRAEPDELLVATLEAYIGSADADADALDLLERLRTAIDQAKPSVVSGLLLAAVVEALPRTPGELHARPLRAAIRSEIERAAEFVTCEPPLRTRPALAIADASDLALLPSLKADLLITEPPSLNFASYASPLPAWFLGMRRTRAPRSRSIKEALGVLRDAGADRKVAGLVTAIRARGSAPETRMRMARIVANYFADMAQWIGVFDRHLLDSATVALELHDSRVAGIEVPTRELVRSLFGASGRSVVFVRE
jgi:hypothetical protein